MLGDSEICTDWFGYAPCRLDVRRPGDGLPSEGGLFRSRTARLLGVLQYGVVVGALALVGMITNYGRLGSSVVFLRHVSADRTQFAVYWGNILLTTLSMSGFIDSGLAHSCRAPHRSRQRRCDRAHGNCQLPL